MLNVREFPVLTSSVLFRVAATGLGFAGAKFVEESGGSCLPFPAWDSPLA